MSLRQWFSRAEERFWLVIFALTLGFWTIPALIFFVHYYDLATATTWSLYEDIDTSAASSGYQLSLTMNHGGYPAVVYFDSTNNKIKYNERNIGGTWTESDVDASIGNGDTTNAQATIGIDPSDNNPTAIYRHNNSGVLKLLYGHYNGSAWATSTISATSTPSYMKPALAFDGSNHPEVAYLERAAGSTVGGELYFGTYSGSAWTTSTILSSSGLFNLDGVGLIYQTASSSEVVVYHDGTNLKMAFRKSSVWTVDSNIIDSTLSSSGATVAYLTLFKDSSENPVVIYTHTNGNLIYGKRLSTGAWTTSTIDSGGGISWSRGAYNSTNDYFGVAYESGASTLKYANNSSGSWATETASSTNGIGVYASLAFYNGSPVMAAQYTNNASGHNYPSLQSATASFGNQAPTAPTIPYSAEDSAQSGSSDPSNLATSTPAFSALFQDPDSGNTASKAEIQVTTSTDGFATVTHWDSGSSGNSISSVAIGARSADIVYNNFGTAATKAIVINDDSVEGATNTSYNWRVRFWDNGGLAGAWSATQTFSILDIPKAPSSVITLLDQTSSTVTWVDNSSLEDSVEAVYSTDGSTYSHLASSTAANLTSTSTTNLTPNTLYYFKARAFDKAGYSAYSAATSGYTLANIPTNLAASSSVYDTANLTWDANSNSASTAYYALNVTAGTNSGWNTGTTYSFTGLQGAKTYQFQVKARNGGSVETSYTSVVATTTLASAPSNLALSVNGTAITASWGANGNGSDAEYEVENTTAGTNSGWISATTYTFNNLTGGTTYTFQVQARNSDHITSAYSSSASAAAVNSSFGSGGSGSGGSGGTGTPTAQPPPDVRGYFYLATLSGNEDYTSSTRVLITVDVSPNVTEYMFSNDPGFVDAVWKPVNSLIYYWDLIGGNGTRTVYAKFKTDTGFVTDVFADSIILDTIKPQPPSITLPANNTRLTNGLVTFAGYAEAGSTVTLNIVQNAAVVASAQVPADAQGAWSYSLLTPLQSATYKIVATATDKAGNTSDPASGFFSVVDLVPPITPTIIFPVDGSIVASSTITTYGRAEPLSKIVIVRDKSLTYETKTTPDGTWSLDLVAPFGDGRHNLDYTSYDLSNNQSATVSVLFLVQASPIGTNPEPLNPNPELPPQNTPPPPVVSTPRNPQPPPPSAGRGGTGGSVTSNNTNGTSFGTGGVTQNTSGGSQSTGTTNEATNTGTGQTNNAGSSPPVTPPQITQIAQTQPLLGPSPIAVIVQGVQRATVAVKVVTRRARVVATQARIVANTPAVQTINKAVLVPAVASIAIASVSTAVGGSQVALYLQFLFLQPAYLLNRKKRRGWGVAYNALTRMPVDLALVRLVDAQEKRIVQSRVTDAHGRYEFFAKPGTFVLEIDKPNFQFPPTYLKNAKEDGRFVDLYTGQPIQLSAPAPVSYNIPLDPVGMEKPIAQSLKDAAKKNIARVVSMTGVAVTTGSFIITPTVTIGCFLVGHIGLLMLFHHLAHTKKPKGAGVIYDETTHRPIEKAVVRIFDTQYNKLLETQVTDAKGRYGFLVGENNYYLMVERVGYEKYVSDQMAIGKSEEGALIANDIILKHATEEVAITQPVAPPTEIIIATATTTAGALPTQLHAPEESAQSVSMPVVSAPAPVRYVPKEFIPLSDVSAKVQPAEMLMKKFDFSLSKPSLTAQEDSGAQPLQGRTSSELEKELENIAYKKIAPLVPRDATVISGTNLQKSFVLGGGRLVDRLLGPVSTGARDMIFVESHPSKAKSATFAVDGDFLAGLADQKHDEEMKKYITTHEGDLFAAYNTVTKRLS